MQQCDGSEKYSFNQIAALDCDLAVISVIYVAMSTHTQTGLHFLSSWWRMWLFHVASELKWNATVCACHILFISGETAALSSPSCKPRAGSCQRAWIPRYIAHFTSSHTDQTKACLIAQHGVFLCAHIIRETFTWQSALSVSFAFGSCRERDGWKPHSWGDL